MREGPLFLTGLYEGAGLALVLVAILLWSTFGQALLELPR